ncbi:hypothetical protein JZ785_02165 [Alicyclobacillus curvatus]|nr:hypothetical protein JZ785_02165 [Alicyclobacillus curvatus]
MRKIQLLVGLAGLTFSLTACDPIQNATNNTGNALNGAAGFANQAVDSLNTPNRLHSGAQAPANSSSAMGLGNSGMQNRIGAANLGALTGNSTVQVDNATKTVRLVFTPRTSTSSADVRGPSANSSPQTANQRLTSISIPVGWSLRATMRSNQGANTHGGAAALSVVPYSMNAGATSAGIAGAGDAAGRAGQNRASSPAAITFSAKQPGVYAIVMHQTGVRPYIMTLVSVTPTIKVPVVSFPAS